MRVSGVRGRLVFVPSVALTHPLWWVACRSLRVMTGLAALVLALALGASGRLAPAEPSPTATTRSTSTPVTRSAPAAITWRPGSEPTSRLAGSEPTSRLAGSGHLPRLAAAGKSATGTATHGPSGSPAEVTPPVPLAAPRPAVPVAGAARADAHVWAFGQRSPPRR
jgi:hypothetical protein